eukprot:554466-Prorocentrum_minimum.AAC.1
MAKHFDDEYYFSQPRPRRARLLRCCEGGLGDPGGDAIGLRASGSEDYHDFKPYFDKASGSEDYHDFKPYFDKVRNDDDDAAAAAAADDDDNDDDDDDDDANNNAFDPAAEPL